ncbi:MAG: MerR family transcriptional regulator [Calditerrivibrio sp.]|nr:MerR family transcriptional regulator [Calditerrivibrio sp.]MCA1933773.1 MerR family transcriptional regulator [Calditerrivibrio sp.]MCA1981233.1 MerR family transcriptional regulator [Calditerrivibrio sp.]
MHKKIYYRIGEVCNLTDLKPSVIRFWEKEFPQLRPVKIGSAQRYYTEEHISLILKIKSLLYDEKMTILGAKKKLNAKDKSDRSDIKMELKEILDILKS